MQKQRRRRLQVVFAGGVSCHGLIERAVSYFSLFFLEGSL
jgi:hypothetical protein